MITPLDIKKQDFSVRLKGFDVDEVHAFLDNLAKGFEELTKQNVQLSENLKVAEERLNHYRLIEKTLQDTVITIQTTLEEKRQAARLEAEVIVREARQKAHDELFSYRNRVSELRGEIYALENQKMQFFTRFRSLLRSQIQVLEAMSAAEEREDSLPRPEENRMEDGAPSLGGDSRLA